MALAHVTETIPTTFAGAARLASFIVDYIARSDFDLRTHVDRANETLARGMAQLTGEAAPVPAEPNARFRPAQRVEKAMRPAMERVS